jgi:2-dehydro-3-deoxygluconokinase
MLLQIPKKTSDGIDFAALGALVIRLDSGITPIEYADTVQMHVSGGEYNVAANLARAFGERTAIISAMVDYPLGWKIESEVRKMEVIPFYTSSLMMASGAPTWPTCTAIAARSPSTRRFLQPEQ